MTNSTMYSPMYQFSVPPLRAMLSNLGEILRLAKAHAETSGVKDDVFLGTRVFPDMFPLSRQVQVACDFAKSGVARLSGAEQPSFPDNEQSFEALIERVAKTIAFIDSVKPQDFGGAEEKRLDVRMGGKQYSFVGQDYLQNVVLPQFYFHVTTAYAILRSSGVALGKDHFTGGYSANR